MERATTYYPSNRRLFVIHVLLDCALLMDTKKGNSSTYCQRPTWNFFNILVYPNITDTSVKHSGTWFTGQPAQTIPLISLQGCWPPGKLGRRSGLGTGHSTARHLWATQSLSLAYQNANLPNLSVYCEKSVIIYITLSIPSALCLFCNHLLCSHPKCHPSLAFYA